MSASPSDQDLIVEYRSTKDLKTLATLYKRYDSKVFQTCMSILKNATDSEDACVDLFIELKEKLLKYQAENFGAWFYTLCRHHCLRILKYKAKVLLGNQEFITSSVNIEENTSHIDKWLEKLPLSIDALPHEQRDCIILFYLQAKTYREITEIRGYTHDQVRSYIQHGKKNLRKSLSLHV